MFTLQAKLFRSQKRCSPDTRWNTDGTKICRVYLDHPSPMGIPKAGSVFLAADLTLSLVQVSGTIPAGSGFTFLRFFVLIGAQFHLYRFGGARGSSES